MNNVELVYEHTGERHLPECPFVIEYGWAKPIACTCPHIVGVDDSHDRLQATIGSLTAERDRYREALESIANPFVYDAEAQTWIARAALGLDGEG